MLWRLAVAVAALTGLMTSSTVLVAQVVHDVENDFGGCRSLDCIPSLAAKPPDGITPLGIGDVLKLAGNTDMELPAGTFIDENGNIVLPDGTEVPLTDADIKNMTMDLVGDGALNVPEGTTINPDGTITLGDQGTVSIPGVGDYNLPAGTTLEVPPDVHQGLVNENGGTGVLDEAKNVRLDAGTSLKIPNMKAPEGATLPSKGGTTLTPPAGTDLGLTPGTTLTEPTKVTLPEGTDVKQAAPLAVLGGGLLAYSALNSDGSTASGFTSDNLPAALPGQSTGGSGSGGDTGGDGGTGEDPADDGPTSQPVRLTWDLADPNQQIKKGEPFGVVGRVASTRGQGIQDVPVTLYANDRAIGSGTSSTGGAFGFEATVPADMPAGPITFHAESAPGTYGGILYDGGYAE